jgi:uncharacterized flavoprotein (TIGR03862 family)
LKKTVSIIGGGTSALILGCELDTSKFDVIIYEKNAAPGRKFLVAGEGGLNLTHSENSASFILKYTPPGFFEKAFANFTNSDLIKWINAIGIETYVGSSGRVFPKRGIKPVEVLNAILGKLKQNNVKLRMKHEWKGFSESGHPVVEHAHERLELKSDIVIFCLGGASWPVTGSTGDWAGSFREKGVRVNPFGASNCAFAIAWDPALISKTEGKALKNISLSIGDLKHYGEVVITRFGMEGSGIYRLSPRIREQLNLHQEAVIDLDLKPSLSAEKICEKLRSKPGAVNLTEYLRTALNLDNSQIALLKHFVSKQDFLDPQILSARVKNLQLTISGMGPVTEAISTVGGVSLTEIDETYGLKKLPGMYAVGEMLDFDAPTGGYLLQACFSMGKYLADHLNGLSFFPATGK